MFPVNAADKTAGPHPSPREHKPHPERYSGSEEHDVLELDVTEMSPEMAADRIVARIQDGFRN
jgi:hypothetical protein